MIKLSKVHKLDGIKSWSLPAVKTCPGSVTKTGDCCEICRFCYAQTGNYRFQNVKATREHNMKDWKRHGFVNEFVQRLEGETYFRWFDSGDCYHPALAEKIYEIIRRTPHVQHWIATRMHKVPIVHRILKRIDKLPNAVVRYSADKFGEYKPGIRAAVSGGTMPKKGTICPATWKNKDGMCGGCRACWDKKVKVVTYKVHTKRAIKHVEGV